MSHSIRNSVDRQKSMIWQRNPVRNINGLRRGWRNLFDRTCDRGWRWLFDRASLDCGMATLERIIQIEQELKELLQDCIDICRLVQSDADQETKRTVLSTFFARLKSIREGFVEVAGALPVAGLPGYSPVLRDQLLAGLAKLESSLNQ